LDSVITQCKTINYNQ